MHMCLFAIFCVLRSSGGFSALGAGFSCSWGPGTCYNRYWTRRRGRSFAPRPARCHPSNPQEKHMTIKEGDRIPEGTLAEYVQVETDACGLGPNPFKVGEQAKGKTVALFAVPGAFTPTCSEKHLPGYLEAADQLKAKGVDEIWCVAVNAPFVMGAWGKSLGVDGRVRML